MFQRGELFIHENGEGGYVLGDGKGDFIHLSADELRWLSSAAVPAVLRHARPVVIVEAAANEGQLEGQLKIDS